MSVSELVPWFEGHFYFWSFDETGQSLMSEEECERWGLPVLTISMPCGFNFVQLRSWPTHIYTALQDWQKVRGFDPATSDWAQELGHLEFEILDKKANGSWWEAILGSGITAVAV
ncbi:hypothetical protein MPER_05901 [Moniliophthora perniciosa FA553]|nr:hypothetical protein MPER_05901 [Moniliophthora perniciosa FA553]